MKADEGFSPVFMRLVAGLRHPRKIRGAASPITRDGVAITALSQYLAKAKTFNHKGHRGPQRKMQQQSRP
jgi:hypothetical protein